MIRPDVPRPDRATQPPGPRPASARCKQRTEVYSRVVGYFRPVQHWNKGKQAEFADRVPFRLGGVPVVRRESGEVEGP
jgi:ribonucleoside-triphosphate reductase